MLWYNDLDSVKTIRDGQYETNNRRSRLMRLVRDDAVSSD